MGFGQFHQGFHHRRFIHACGFRVTGRHGRPRPSGDVPVAGAPERVQSRGPRRAESHVPVGKASSPSGVECTTAAVPVAGSGGEAAVRNGAACAARTCEWRRSRRATRGLWGGVCGVDRQAPHAREHLRGCTSVCGRPVVRIAHGSAQAPRDSELRHVRFPLVLVGDVDPLQDAERLSDSRALHPDDERSTAMRCDVGATAEGDMGHREVRPEAEGAFLWARGFECALGAGRTGTGRTDAGGGGGRGGCLAAGAARLQIGSQDIDPATAHLRPATQGDRVGRRVREEDQRLVHRLVVEVHAPFGEPSGVRGGQRSRMLPHGGGSTEARSRRCRSRHEANEQTCGECPHSDSTSMGPCHVRAVAAVRSRMTPRAGIRGEPVGVAPFRALASRPRRHPQGGVAPQRRRGPADDGRVRVMRNVGTEPIDVISGVP